MSGSFAHLVTLLREGRVSRRDFLQQATAMGVGAGTAIALAGNLHAQTPAASPVTAGSRPETGTDGQTRGAGGELRILIWQAPTVAAPHSALSDKDYLAAAPVIEPLMHYLPDGSIIPNLVETVPSVENGLLASDLTSATLKLLPGVMWSDGEPVTARDIRFTWQWVTNTANGATSLDAWSTIADIEVVDDLTAQVTFAAASVLWFEPFAGNYNGNLYPAHAFGNDPNNLNNEFALNPIGTGPFKFESFSPNENAVYVVNELYREPNKPYFSRILLTGGGDPASAARAVMETGDYDYAWNLQVEPEVLEQIQGDGSIGKVYGARGTTVEGLHFNFSDPWTEVDGERSQKDTPHPIFSDKAVRQALSLAVNRQLIQETLYTDFEPVTSNVLAGVPAWDSPNTTWEFNIDTANQILDEAGWVLDGDVRSKDGVELAFNYITSITPVRQKTQLIVQSDWQKIGAKVEIDAYDASIFFSGASDQDQNFYHMFWDLDMWTNGPYSALPISWMDRWYAGPDGENIAQAANEWKRNNTQRYQNPEYDAAYEALLQVQTVEEAEAGLIALNDMLIDDVAMIPIINRNIGVYALSNRVSNDNVSAGPSFVLPMWNIANWTGTE